MLNCPNTDAFYHWLLLALAGAEVLWLLVFLLAIILVLVVWVLDKFGSHSTTI